jgi:putative endonuclease
LVRSNPMLHLQSKLGELAQLARALAWHARGHRFESGILHKRERLLVPNGHSGKRPPVRIRYSPQNKSRTSLRDYYFMSFSVYIIYSQSLDRYYVGHTENMLIRLDQHNEGISKYTSKANDWQLMYTEVFLNRIEALIRERAIKAKKSRKYLEQLISTQTR